MIQKIHPLPVKVNINTADKDALMTLTGIGSSKADTIIAYRNENGNFKDISEIIECFRNQGRFVQ